MKVVVFQKPMGAMGANGPGQQEPVTSVGRVGTGEMSNAPAKRPTNQEYYDAFKSLFGG